MKKKYDFKNLFVLDLANNHQGDLEHALNIVRSIGKIVSDQNIRAGLKFQFRQFETFIHPSHKIESDNKHIPRFLSTSLKKSDYKVLFDEVVSQKMITICTPFDEESVDVIDEMGFDIIKVASCSAKDWPLLERISSSNKPVIASTGGLTFEGIDNLVSFFEHKGVDFSLMHCVSIYPIPEEKLNLNQITMLKERYPNITIGWSTHEDPDSTIPIQIAVAKGAKMFERHIGIKKEDTKLNAYSSTPQQVSNWINAYKNANKFCGINKRTPADTELDSINTLRRGVFAKEIIKEGDTITRDKVYFAMPYDEKQLDSGHWQNNIISNTKINVDEPLLLSAIQLPDESNVINLKMAVHEVKALLNKARIVLNSEFDVEYSHHYGISRFREVGAVIINCINRDYCKKIIVQLPEQVHPNHFHQKKEETFQVLYGTLNVEVDGHTRTLYPGDTQLIMPGVWHSFGTDTGVVFEEVSTTHYNDDSFYQDKAINKQGRSARKTHVEHWGRFQLIDLIN